MNIIDSKIYLEEIDHIAQNIPLKKCSILVTGASGLIGACIIDSIIYANRKYENNIHIYALGRNEEKLKKRFEYANQAFISYIIQDVKELISTDIKFDYIIHTASNADPMRYSQNPVETMQTTLFGTNNLLEYCRKNKQTRLLFTSSFEAYGKIMNHDIYCETDSGEIDLNSIRSCYPESKRCAEILIRSFNKEYSINCVIARLSSIYGPTMLDNDSKAHAQFIRNALKGEDIVLKSKGIQKRTYCYVMDAVSALFTILFKGVCGETYNISNENSVVTISHLAEIIASVSETQVVYDNPDEFENQGYSRPQNCVLDNTKLRSLGWKGEYSVYDGIKSTIKILKDCL